MKLKDIILKALFLFIILFSSVNAEQKIAFLDIQKILSKSISGNFLNTSIKKLQDDKLIEFKDKKKNLQNDEKKLIAKKNILEESKFEEQKKDLKTKIINFNNERKIFTTDLNKKKISGTNQILKTLDPILKDYASKNSISLILQKKNILLGENSIDITDDILKLLDNKIKKIDLE
jgi:Skp family chaperone for outer membrane proteins